MIRAVSQFNNNSYTMNFKGSRTAVINGRAKTALDHANISAGVLLGSLSGNLFSGFTEKPAPQWITLHLTGLLVGGIIGAMITFIKNK